MTLGMANQQNGSYWLGCVLRNRIKNDISSVLGIGLYTQSNPTGIYISLDDFGQYYEENGKEFEPTESYFLDDYEDNLPAKWTSATELCPWQPYQK